MECRACRERARETPNMACCRCQDEDAFCNNDVAKVGFVTQFLLYMNNISNVQPPARLPIEDFPVRRPELGPGLTCQNSIACTLFDDCDEVISLQVILLGQGDWIVTPPPKSLCVRTKVRVELATISLKTTSPCVKLGGGRVVQGDR